ncbi:hypothetical protein EJB05_09071, partial [Eragrostis curvula]
MPPCSRRLAPQGGWASLHEDLVQLIAWRVLAAGDLLDYTHFRAVCSGWNAGAVSPRGRGLADTRFHPRRWMMFPEGHGLYPGHPDLGGYVRLVNLSSGDFVRVHLPLIHDSTDVAIDSTDGGLLLLLQKHDVAVRLVNPFTGDVADLPPLLPLLPLLEPQRGSRLSCISEYHTFHELSIFRTGVCAAVNVTAAGEITVMLAIDRRHRVAYATVGDRQWCLSAWKLPRLSARTMAFQGKLLYAAAVNTSDVYIYQIDLLQQHDGLSLPPPKMIAKCPLVGKIGTAHLVECASELMLVGSPDASREHLKVYRVADLISGNVVPVTNIGEHAIFLDEWGVCVSANKGFPSVLGNTVICRHRRQTPQVDTCNPWERLSSCSRYDQFDLDSGTWSPALDADILHRDRAPARPYMLGHHILTCCNRYYWNTGLIFCSPMISR